MFFEELKTFNQITWKISFSNKAQTYQTKLQQQKPKIAKTKTKPLLKNENDKKDEIKWNESKFE